MKGADRVEQDGGILQGDFNERFAPARESSDKSRGALRRGKKNPQKSPLWEPKKPRKERESRDQSKITRLEPKKGEGDAIPGWRGDREMRYRSRKRNP